MMVRRDGNRIVVPHKHHHANTNPIYIGVTVGDQQPIMWRAAYRDMDGTKPVVFADFPDVDGPVVAWIRDDDGDHRVGVTR